MFGTDNQKLSVLQTYNLFKSSIHKAIILFVQDMNHYWQFDMSIYSIETYSFNNTCYEIQVRKSTMKIEGVMTNYLGNTRNFIGKFLETQTVTH